MKIYVTFELDADKCGLFEHLKEKSFAAIRDCIKDEEACKGDPLMKICLVSDKMPQEAK
jgi:hypothetical protein